MEIKRRKFQGVLNILSFNRHFYVGGLIGFVLILLSYLFFDWYGPLFWIILLAMIYGLLMPLIISAYVYDFSGYYYLNWLKKYKLEDSSETQIVNINAGFDETSFLLKNQFKKSDLKVFDFYNKKQHTEPAIIRARKVSNTYPNTLQISTQQIPLPDQSVDLLFLLSAAHEIRNEQEKIEFLRECRRICKPKGTVIMVEHLRDFPNFLAFSIGFTHFFSRRTWKKSFTEAGFRSFEETKFTPFMSVFNCKS